MNLLLASLLGCSLFSWPEKAPCADPHLWYAPDGSGDTYFGCTRPEGWLETPVDEVLYAASTQTATVQGPDPERVQGPDIDTGQQEVTFPPQDTAPPSTPVGDTGLPAQSDTGPAPPDDTGELPDEDDTGALPPEDDTSDTGALPPEDDTSDTGALPPEVAEDTALPPVEDTSTPPPVEDDDTGTP